MKKLIILSLTILLYSCGRQTSSNNFTIYNFKSIDSLNCKYQVEIPNNGLTFYLEFIDTCGKFKMGQKIEIK